MKVYPVRYSLHESDVSGIYFIVARDQKRAEEIAFSCIANNPAPPCGTPDRSTDYGRQIAKVFVIEWSAAETNCMLEGLIGSGSEVLLAKALALYIEKYDSLS